MRQPLRFIDGGSKLFLLAFFYYCCMSSCDVPRKILIQDKDELPIIFEDSSSLRVTASDFGKNLFVNIQFLSGDFLFDTSISPKIILENGAIQNVIQLKFAPDASVMGEFKKISSPAKQLSRKISKSNRYIQRLQHIKGILSMILPGQKQ
ncbi:MAG: hypothetical protein QM763_00830 [Agriterribacter sp.]